MKGGYFKCPECGQEQYVETVRNYSDCIKCGTKHEVFPIPEMAEDKTQEEDTP